jgi:large subunit ribosomal protein L2
MKRYKPTSPGRRTYETTEKDNLTDEDPVESLTEGLKTSGGRNNTGRITARGKGGGNKNKYRNIDFKRDKDGVPSKVVRFEYDPNRSARIALLQYEDGEKRYILAPRDLEIGEVLESGPDASIRPGNTLPLENIPVGTFIHNVELKPGAGGSLCRSAGISAQLASKDEGYGLIELPSDQGRRVLLECRATIGRIGNVEHINRVRGKAGQSRYENERPVTRGMARNPVDHPLGGGEGRIKGGHPEAPGGGLTLGEKTRSNKRTDKFVVSNIRE